MLMHGVGGLVSILQIHSDGSPSWYYVEQQRQSSDNPFTWYISRDGLRLLEAQINFPIKSIHLSAFQKSSIIFNHPQSFTIPHSLPQPLWRTFSPCSSLGLASSRALRPMLSICTAVLIAPALPPQGMCMTTPVHTHRDFSHWSSQPTEVISSNWRPTRIKPVQDRRRFLGVQLESTGCSLAHVTRRPTAPGARMRSALILLPVTVPTSWDMVPKCRLGCTARIKSTWISKTPDFTTPAPPFNMVEVNCQPIHTPSDSEP